MKKKENYLEKIPVRSENIKWTTDNGITVLQIENKGAVKRLTQILLRKPKTSYIHLDEMGSFIWSQIDGEKNIIELGRDVKLHFGESAEPLYERLVKYLRILESYEFTGWKNK